jgi:hypothetical protein
MTDFKIIYQRLLEVTAEYMSKKKLSELSLKEHASRKDSCWGGITQAYFNNFHRNKSLQIYTMWKRNDKGYRTDVKTILDKLRHCQTQQIENRGKFNSSKLINLL